MKPFKYYNSFRDTVEVEVKGVPELAGRTGRLVLYNGVCLFRGEHFIAMFNIDVQVSRVLVTEDSNVLIDKDDVDHSFYKDILSYNDKEHAGELRFYGYSEEYGFGVLHWKLEENGDYRDPDGFGGGSNDVCVECIYDRYFNIVCPFIGASDDYTIDRDLYPMMDELIQAYNDLPYSKCINNNSGVKSLVQEPVELPCNFKWDPSDELQYNTIEAMAMSIAYRRGYHREQLPYWWFKMLNGLLQMLKIDLSQANPNYIMQYVMRECLGDTVGEFWFKPHFEFEVDCYGYRTNRRYIFELAYVFFFCVWNRFKDKQGYTLQNDDILDVIRTKVDVTMPLYFEAPRTNVCRRLIIPGVRYS